jgi:DNA-binding transcriptional ArsR family regulator
MAFPDERSIAPTRYGIGYSAPIGAVSPTLDGTFFALSDPTRRGILVRLGSGPATISELAQPYGLTLNGIKKHVGILERADLGEATEWIDGYRAAWEGRLDRFAAFVEEGE